MKRRILKTLQFALFVGIGVFLFWKIYKDQPLDELLAAARQVDYAWVAAGLLIGVASHAARAARWGLALDAAGVKARPGNLFYMVMVNYLANYVFPRMGEVTRAAVLRKYEGAPFVVGLGTVVTERVVDFVILVLLTLWVVVSQSGFLADFLTHNPAVSDNLSALLTARNLALAAVAAALCAAAWLLFRRLTGRGGLQGKVWAKAAAFKDGLVSIFKIRRWWLYILYSALTWGLYYLNMYVVFLAFGFTATVGIGWTAAMVVFVLSSYGNVAPVQGGIGAYHFMVIASLVIYGVSDTDARLFALVSHGATTLLVIALGCASLALLPLANRGRKIATQG